MKHFYISLLAYLLCSGTANASKQSLDVGDSLLIPSEQIIITLLQKLNEPEDSRPSIIQRLTSINPKETSDTEPQPIVLGSKVVSWDKVQLSPTWKNPVATAHRVSHVIRKSEASEGDNYLFYAETKQTQEDLKSNVTYGTLAFFSFILFWHTRIKIKEGVHQSGWKIISRYLILIGCLNLITLTKEWSVLVALFAGLLLALYFFEAERNHNLSFLAELEDLMPDDAWRLLFRGMFIWVPAGLIIFHLHLSEASFSYLQFNLMMVSAIVCGNLLALILLTILKFFVKMGKALFARKKASA